MTNLKGFEVKLVEGIKKATIWNEISLWESYFQYLLIKTETSYRQNSNGNSSIFTFLLGRRNNKEKMKEAEDV